ncbi:MutS-related protein [[Clostridium] fimetarium]|uniref:MutS domain V n=1 Tax=[Clostridium] fimetarium TaxID=99656 RepID=A0A1I0QKU6_9FIRM|nr:hypothetical protein [[Clostridium] fimetarium]SEW27624.1 MutS domain V [[Clostridium] fimetarium]
MDSTQWVIFMVVVFTILIFMYIDTTRKTKIRITNMLRNSWGKEPNKDLSYDEFENISHYFRGGESDSNVVDDITWNDLDMDRIFMMMNNTHSSVGREYLYKILRKPEKDSKQLLERHRLAEFFRTHEKERLDVQRKYLHLGYASGISVTDYVDMIVNLVPGKNIFHYLCNVIFSASVLYCFLLNAQLGVLAIIAATGLCIISYYKYKSKVDRYFICVKHIVNMVSCAKELEKLDIPELSEYNQEFKALEKTFDTIVKNSSILSSGAADGSLPEIILDYVRMITHLDLVKFNQMVKKLNNHIEDIYALVESLGKIEATISIASFRELLPYWTTPNLSKNENLKIDVTDVYHPLISDPVTNSMSESRSILLTGSNASGKSTFLKTIAINAILSQTIYTSPSKGYKANYFRIYSSMALQDDLGSSESYYIVEIKALKRILDVMNLSDIPVLCFVDEVLRGTNTVERIAASSQILYSFTNCNVMTFAATHDIELTSILEKYYSNYHFEEEVSDDDILFNYKLFKGRATSRNAIKLLGIIGYDKKIIQTSERMAEAFSRDGKWGNIE